MFNKALAQEHLDKLLKQHKIKVHAIASTSCGSARCKTRSIKIPKPTSVDRFCVCMHEVKHILDGNKGKRFEQEFACDLYALNVIKELGWPTEAWEKRMRWHSLSRIAMAANRGLNMATISQEIKTFFSELDWEKWKNKKVFVKPDSKSIYGYTVKFYKNLSKEDVSELLKADGLFLSKSQVDDSTYNKWIVTGDGSISDFDTIQEIIIRYKL